MEPYTRRLRIFFIFNTYLLAIYCYRKSLSNSIHLVSIEFKGYHHFSSLRTSLLWNLVDLVSLWTGSVCVNGETFIHQAFISSLSLSH